MTGYSKENVLYIDFINVSNGTKFEHQNLAGDLTNPSHKFIFTGDVAWLALDCVCCASVHAFLCSQPHFDCVCTK